jgi:hypothetical protein
MKTPLPGMEPCLDTLLHVFYTRARFDLRLDYRQPPKLPLTPDDSDWAATLAYSPPL